MKLLIILTSHSQLGEMKLANSQGKTGFWIEEFSTPYYLFKKAGFEITLASPKGGQPPIDPRSDTRDTQTPSVLQYKNDRRLLDQMANTIPLSDVNAKDFDVVFYPGGHGPLWDLTNDEDSIRLIESFWKAGKPIGAVCHGPAVLLHAKDEKEGLLLNGKKVTGFSNTEEEAIKLTKVVPFLLEDQLKMKGANYSKAHDFTPYVVKDKMLITGQNPASSEGVANELINAAKKRKL